MAFDKIFNFTNTGNLKTQYKTSIVPPTNV